MSIDYAQAETDTETAAASSTDTELIMRIRAGDRDAFPALYERYIQPVSAVIWKFGGGSSIEDLAQNVFLTAWQKMDHVQNPETVGGWLCAIARHLTINKVKRERHAFQFFEDDEYSAQNEVVDDAMDTPEVFAIVSEDRLRIRKALGSLDSLHRPVVQMFYMEGLKLKDIAKTLERPLGTVKRQLHVARKRLAATLDPPVERCA